VQAAEERVGSEVLPRCGSAKGEHLITSAGRVGYALALLKNEVFFSGVSLAQIFGGGMQIATSQFHPATIGLCSRRGCSSGTPVFGQGSGILSKPQ
jgi:hypothetical protein